MYRSEDVRGFGLAEMALSPSSTLIIFWFGLVKMLVT